MINNHTTASFCVHLGLQDFAVFDNPLMQRAIAEYVPRIRRAKVKEEELAKSEGREPGQYWAEIDSPKVSFIKAYPFFSDPARSLTRLELTFGRVLPLLFRSQLLGDVVEAVYAAILVDSGLQWKAVEDFHKNVQRPWMDKYIRGLGSLAGREFLSSPFGRLAFSSLVLFVKSIADNFLRRLSTSSRPIEDAYRNPPSSSESIFRSRPSTRSRRS